MHSIDKHVSRGESVMPIILANNDEAKQVQEYSQDWGCPRELDGQKLLS